MPTQRDVTDYIADHTGDASQRELLCALEIMRTSPDAKFVPTMRRAGSKVATDNGKEYDVSVEAFGVSDGALLFPKKDGTARADVQKRINDLLKEAFKGEGGTTIREMRKLFRPIPPEVAADMNWISGYVIASDDELIRVDSDEYDVDPDVKRLLEDYGVYTTAKDRAENIFYPFILIGLPNGTNLRYNIYRVVAGLPFYTQIAPGYRLPTVDHIHRETRDNRRGSLRYCTVSQNLSNRCRRSEANKFHHVVSKHCVVQINGIDTRRDQMFVCGSCMWFSMFSMYATDAKRSLVPDPAHVPLPSFHDGFDECNRVHAGIDEIPLDERALLSQLVEEVLSALQHGWSLYIVDNTVIRKDLVLAQDVRKRPMLEFLLRQHVSEVIPIQSFGGKEYLAAIAADVAKICMDGEFAHTNFVRPPRPAATRKVIDHVVRPPADILNMFEQCIAQTLVDDRNQSLFAQAPPSPQRFWYSTAINDVDKLLFVRAVLASTETGNDDDGLEFTKFDRGGGEEITISSPFTVYYAPPSSSSSAGVGGRV